MPLPLATVQATIDRLVAYCGLEDVDARADIAQRVLIKAWQKGDTIRCDGALEGWLRRVVTNEVASWARRESARARLRRQVAQWPIPPRDLAEIVVHRVSAQRMLERLDGEDRRLVELAYVEGLTSSEIAEIFGLADSSVRCRLMRLGRRLRACPDRLAS